MPGREKARRGSSFCSMAWRTRTISERSSERRWLRAAGLTDTVARASAGALSHLPVAKVANLARTMEELKKGGYWLIGLDEEAERSYTQADYTSPVGIVLGGEGKGLHELTRKRCDFVVSLPTVGPVKSLNVSVAAGVVLFEALRQRRGKAAV